MPLRLLADEAIPHAEAAFSALGTVRLLPGHAITREAVAGADVLLVRSVTRVGEALLTGSPVRFVGTATAGTDHLDTAWLREAGVAWADAPGSNAESVAEYVLAALLALAVGGSGSLGAAGLRGRPLGVVGVGHVGSRVARRAAALGLRVLACDPPRAEAGDPSPSSDGAWRALPDVLAEADIVTLHTPLAASGPHPTLHLVDADALARLRPGAVLVNAARGGVVDGAALLAALRAGRLTAALDVWEGEPAPDAALVDAVALATPHIAGYSVDGKVEGTRMLAAAVRAWAVAEGLATPEAAAPWDAEAVLAAEPLAVAAAPLPAGRSGADEAAWLDALARQAYDVRDDDARFREAMAGATGDARAAAFRRLRATYPARRAWTRYAVRGLAPKTPAAWRAAVADGLGMRIA